MAASRRLYVNVAEGIQAVLADQSHDGNRAGEILVARVAREVASALASDNIRFNYQRFYTACGLRADGHPR